ncbi:MAG: hypothetical protein LPH21_12405, partial [Shewanella sp.]|nr:hypothetical protein [Shewanella sp.]
MKFYLILPEPNLYEQYEWYFKHIVHFINNNVDLPFFISGGLEYIDNKVFYGINKVSLSDMKSHCLPQDMVFDFYGNNCFPGTYYFDICPSTLDCCLYSSLYLKQKVFNHDGNVTCPVELLSCAWFETLHKPFPGLDFTGKQNQTVYVDQGMSSERRAKMAYHAQHIIADGYSSALEAILLGIEVDFPDKPR